jgi:predicted Zn finger-like uncharacterized protein
MLIVCPSCATSYDVGLASLSPNGRHVRCARCRAVWRAEPGRSEKLAAAAAAIDPAHEMADAAAGAAENVRSFAAQAAAEAPGAWAAEGAGSPRADLDHIPATGRDTPPAAHAAREVLAPPIAPAEAEEGAPLIVDIARGAGEGAGESGQDVETAAARLLRQGANGQTLRSSPRLLMGILALALIDIVLVGWRADIARVLPQTASFYAMLGLPVNLRGLTFSDVITGAEQHEGVPILVVEGNIANTARKTVDVPRLKFILRNAARQEIYAWTAVPSRNLLQPGEAVAFRARLASPPPEAHDIVLRFVSRHDIVSGGR